MKERRNPLWQTQEQRQKKQQPQNSASRREFSFTFEQNDPLDEQLRKPRSRAYMEIFDAVDLLSATDEEIIEKLKQNMDPDAAEEFAEMSVEELLEEIRASIQEEFRAASLEMQQLMHGIVAKCYIEGCDCHAISPEGKVLAHYEVGRPMPTELERGRALIERFPECKCVEVYKDCCRVVMKDASIIRLRNHEL